MNRDYNAVAVEFGSDGSIASATEATQSVKILPFRAKVLGAYLTVHGAQYDAPTDGASKVLSIDQGSTNIITADGKSAGSGGFGTAAVDTPLDLASFTSVGTILEANTAITYSVSNTGNGEPINDPRITLMVEPMDL